MARTALSLASQNGHFDVVQALLAAKVEVNAKSVNGETALLLASWQRHLEVVRALLAANADVNAKAADGATALALPRRMATWRWCRHCSPQKPM